MGRITAIKCVLFTRQIAESGFKCNIFDYGGRHMRDQKLRWGLLARGLLILHPSALAPRSEWHDGVEVALLSLQTIHIPRIA